MIPSANTIQRIPGVDRATALKIRRVLDGRLDPRKASEKCDKWVKQCFHEPSRISQQHAAVDDLLGNHGIEAVEDGDMYTDTDRMCPRLSYSNAGDTYSMTVIRDHKRRCWIVASYGDIVERERIGE